MAPVISRRSEFDTEGITPLCLLVTVGDRQAGGISASINGELLNLVSGEKNCFGDTVAVSGRTLKIKVVIDRVPSGARATVTITLSAGSDHEKTEEYDLTDFVENGQVTGDFKYDIY